MGVIASLASVSHGAAIDEGWIWGTLFDALRAADAALAGGTIFMALAIVLLFSVEAAPGRTLDNPAPRTAESVAAGADGRASDVD